MKEIINKVEKAGLIILDPSTLILRGQRKKIDLIEWLENGFVIRETVFKKRLKETNWSEFENTFVTIMCSKDVIIAPWMYLLIQTKLCNIAKQVFFGEIETMNILLFKQALEKLDLTKYKNKRVFLKVCGDEEIPMEFLSLCVQTLFPVVKSLFYGEPCSSIPLIKN